ncbi:MAG: chromate transporter [Clostridia bacterium]|nr:chromate transporter [Clostridia bacterium]
MIYLELLWTFFKIGAFTFGGGYAMLPLIQDEVLAHGWMELSELIDFIAVSESTPGPFAVNIATYVGAEVGGLLGSVCATLGVVLPSFIIILIVAKFFEKFKESRAVKGVMTGLKPAVVGLIGAAIITMAVTVFIPTGFSTAIFTDTSFYVSLVIFALCLVLALKKVAPIIVICLSALLGIAAGFLL